MAKYVQNIGSTRPYVLGLGLVLILAYVLFAVWISLRPADAMDHMDKVLCLVLMISIPGKYALDHVLKRFELADKLVDSIHASTFMGLALGLIWTETATSLFHAASLFAGGFLLAFVSLLVLNFAADKGVELWRSRRAANNPRD